MVHGDDNGMFMPPRLAPAHVAILPIIRREEDRSTVLEYCHRVKEGLTEQIFHDRSVEVIVDDRDMNAGEKGWHWIRKGIPVRVEIGPKDIEKNAVFTARRDRAPRDKESRPREAFIAGICGLLEDIQSGLRARAAAFMKEHTRQMDEYQEFAAFFTPKNPEKPENHGGFALSPWCGDAACEERAKSELAVTIRCIPLDRTDEPGRCILCGKPAEGRVVFAKAY
jgi:prolyl-tRNA synthetase